MLGRDMPRRFPELEQPIIGAPLAGGPSTPALTAAVSEAGGLGFLAAGYLSAEAVGEQIGEARRLTDAPFGVNMFCLSESPVEAAALDAYQQRIAGEASALGAVLGTPRFEDDEFEAKLELVLEAQIPIVSFTFGCPSVNAIDRLHERGRSVWVTVTEPGEAAIAEECGADALVVQGVEAGGHRGSFLDADGVGEISLAVLLALIAQKIKLPLVATGGIMDGRAVAAAITSGASAAQLGSALLLAPEAGTSEAHREALALGGRTALTRAFTGRRARGIVNRFMVEHGRFAPPAYPHIHHLTAPLRRAAREQGHPEVINLWAGQGYALAQARPAEDLVREFGAQARALLPGH
jgi:nitronate monooxygenase